MSSSTPGRIRIRSVTVAVLAAACVIAVVTVAAQSPGYAGSSVTATLRTVWVTNAGEFLLGRINRQIDELDSAAALSSADFDVLQSGEEVFAVDDAAHQLRSVDPATVTLSAPLDLPDHAVVALGGGVLAIGDAATGRIWTRPANRPGTGDITRAAPAATVAPGLVLAVGTDGTVVATAPGRSRLTVIPPASRGESAAGGRTIPLGRTLSAAGDADGAPIAITTVGTEPVILDRPAGMLTAVPAAAASGRSNPPARSLALPRGSAGATLQQSGPAADAVLVATTTALLRVTIADGTVGTFASGTTGTPVAPVWLNGCANAAWSGQHPTYLAWCGAEPTIRPVPVTAGGSSAHALVFRVNRSEIVLNDISTGDAFVLDKQLTVINNWSQVAPPRQQDSQQQNNRGNENDSEQATLSRTNCSGTVTPPVAENDSFGVRAGRPAILPVTANDSTTDCAAVVIDSVTALPPGEGTVSIVNSGRALQVTAAADATGMLPSVSYRLSDGAGHTSTAQVALTVVPASEHPAPARLRGSATMVGVGGSITDNVLDDWYSPAGDPLWLTAVSAQGQDLAVGFEPGGSITVHDTGTGGPGKRTVTFALTDGVSIEHGTLSVQVVTPADAAPLASPVYAAARVGVPVTLRPLDSVLVPGTDPARISAVTADPVDGRPPAGLAVSQVTATGTVTVTAGRPGDYRLHYQVAAGALTAEGVMRVVATAAAGTRPVAVTDVGYLAPDGQARLDLTANDLDGGAPLAVRELQVDPDSPLVVTLSDMHIAHVSARRPLPTEGTWFSYTVSDGTAGATGWVHIVPVPQGAGQGPMASPATMVVRAGDAGTLPVADVAQDPDGNAMTVADFTSLPTGQGLLFAAGDTIRYLAPDAMPDGRRTISTVYTVTDTAHRSDSAPLTITVNPPGPDNPPDTPPTAVARVFAGGSVVVPLPLDGIDPDGDWVTVTGIVGSGRLGVATVAAPGAIRYRALGTPGMDIVRYTATDPYGKSVTGLVQVVVVPPPTVAQPPVAPDLKVAVAPRGTIGVDVLGAVTDPAGLPVTFAGSAGAGGSTAPAAGAGIQVPAGAPLAARIEGGVLAVTAHDTTAVVPIGYTVVNSRGLSASGVVTVTITPDAQAIPPTASDVFVDSTMLSADRRSAVVDLADRVSNPGGTPGGLTASVSPVDRGSARATGRLQVTVPLTGQRQVVAYQVRNLQGLTASAFIVVPRDTELVPRSSGDATPTPLQPGVSQLTVDAGQTAVVDIRRYLTGAPPGTTYSLPAGGALSASTGQVSRADAEHLRWVVPENAPQNANLVVEVAAGQATGTAQIPVVVRPAVPTFQSTAVSVAAGGTTPVNLAALVTARPGQKLTYAGPTGARGGVGGRLSGSTLTVSATGGAAKGTRVALGVTVSDGVHPPVPATVTATVVASTAPLAFVPDITANGVQGVTQRIDALAGARNPLPRQGPLTVTGARVISGSGRASFASGGTVSITPGARQVGALAVQVSVADATGDPDRVVTSTITVTVAGRPGQVTGVKVVSRGDRTVDLAWTAPADNGRPIGYYLVRATSGGYQQRCSAARTQCALTGLTNNVGYRFTVTAHNALGDSSPSAPSTAVTPDVAPDAPDAPALSFGDGSISATWKPPVDRGSPITGYLVSISPAPQSGPATVAVAGTSHTFGQLANGTDYQVTVVAKNSSGADSAPSAPAQMVPAAAPGVPGTPGLAYQPDTTSVTATWTASAGNGDDQLTYTVAWTGDDGSQGSVTVGPGKPLSATISPTRLGVTYTATVTAANKAGSSAASAPGSVRAFTPVGPPTGVQAKATGADRTVTVTWSPPGYSGWDLSGYQYQVDGQGQWKGLPDATTATITDAALTNGAAHTVAIRACTQQAADACGTGASSNQVTPYGPMGAPSVSGSVSGSTITFRWSFPGNGNGRPVSSTTVTINGTTVDAGAGQWSGNVGWGQGRTAVATFCVSGPQQCTSASNSQSTGYPVGTVGSAGSPTFQSLSNLTPDGNLAPGTRVQVSCWDPRHLIATDGYDGWFHIASGQYNGQWTAVNNFNSWQALRAQVPQC